MGAFQYTIRALQPRKQTRAEAGTTPLIDNLPARQLAGTLRQMFVTKQVATNRTSGVVIWFFSAAKESCDA